MTIKQLSVFIENVPGRLAEITQILGEHKIDIRALSLADTTKFGILRLIVDNPDEAETSLKKAGLTVTLTKVIAIGIADKPGGLASAIGVLGQGDISIEYMYAFVSREHNTAYVIVRVDDNEKAIELLKANNVTMLTPEEIYSNP